MAISPLSKIYSEADFKIAMQIANDAEAIYKKNPCGIKFKPASVHTGIMLMFSKQYESKLTSKIWKLADDPEVSKVHQSILSCTAKTCTKGFTTFTEFDQYYFRYLFRMCHAKYLAENGKSKEFKLYVNDNEKVRRVIRPKFGSKITPLFEINSEIFRAGKKLLV